MQMKRVNDCCLTPTVAFFFISNIYELSFLERVFQK